MSFKSNYIQVDGSLNVDGSIYQWNQLFVGGGGGGDTASLDASIVRLDAYNVIQDNSIFNIDASIIRIDAYQLTQDNSALYMQATYIPDASLSADFAWVGGFLTVDVSVAGSTVGELDDYSTYEPHPGDVSIYRTGDDVTQIVTENIFGTKVVDFSYDVNGDVDQIDISTYGLMSRVVTFEKDGNGDIIAVHIN